MGIELGSDEHFPALPTQLAGGGAEAVGMGAPVEIVHAAPDGMQDIFRFQRGVAACGEAEAADLAERWKIGILRRSLTKGFWRHDRIEPQGAMPDTTEIIGRHYQTGEGMRVVCGGGVIESTEPAEAPGDVWVAPGIFDPQVNGYAGVDFQRDDLAASDLMAAAAGLRADGCPRWLLTLITDDYDKLIARLAHLKQLRDTDRSLREAIVGWHVEGPFLSQEPGFRGAHDNEVMRDATLADIERLRETLGDDPVLFTIAPERDGSIAAIRRATELGMRVSLGHSNPSVDDLRAAKDAGAVAFTHLGNGCPQALDRHDNFLWRVLDDGGLVAGVIPDSIHVSPLLFRLLNRVLGPEGVYYTTDCMSAAGAPPGRYTVGRLELEVGEDQVVRQPGQTNFAGSALRPWQGVQRAARMLRVSWREVWGGFAERPLGLMGLDTGLAVGKPAALCLVKEDGAGVLQSVEVV